MIVMAHRGWHGPGRPENSMASFERAASAGIGFETDVRTDSSGRTVIVHDRCIAGKAVADMSRREISSKLGHPVLSLSDLLDMGWDVPLNIEFKTKAAYEASRSVLARHRHSDILISSFIHAIPIDAAATHGFEAALLTASLSPAGFMPGMGSHGIKTVVWDYNVVDAEIVASMNADGMRSIAYGPVTQEEHDRLTAMDVHAVITDRPEMALRSVAGKSLVG
jgi:glycerophosphoryl diester phosphodiesterase